MLLRSEDWSLDRISQALRLHKDTIKRHLNEHTESKKLAPENGGSDSKLDATQTRELITHLENNLYQKASDICAYILTKYQIAYTISGITFWLHQHKFSYKAPK